MISRRDLLKLLGIAPVVLSSSIVAAVENVPEEKTFAFSEFDKWLKHTSDVVRSKKLTLFRIVSTQKSNTINVIGQIDTFMGDMAKCRKKNGEINQKKLAKLRRKHEEGEICFQIARNKAPLEFVDWIEKPQGRKTFVDMLHQNRFRGEWLDQFVQTCKQRKKDDSQGDYYNDSQYNEEIAKEINLDDEI